MFQKVKEQFSFEFQKAGFGSDCENIVLTVGAADGEGKIDNIIVQGDTHDITYLAYVEDATLIERVFGFFSMLFSLLIKMI